jgi:hypothetical protein
MAVAAILVEDPVPLTEMLSPTVMSLSDPEAEVVTVVDDVVATFSVVVVDELDDDPGVVAETVMVDPSMAVMVPKVPPPNPPAPPGPRAPAVAAEEEAVVVVDADELMAFTPKTAVAAMTTVPTTPAMRLRRDLARDR